MYLVASRLKPGPSPMVDYNTLAVSLNRYQSLLGAVNGIVWEADAATFQFTFVSESVTRILGYTMEEWLGSPSFWEDHIYPEDREYATSFCQAETRLARDHSFDYRMVKSNGDIVWIRDIISVVMEDGRPRWLRGIMVDITETKLLADLDHLEKEVLELNAQTDTDTATVLKYYVQGIEKLFPQMHCSVLRVAEGILDDWASPSLPEKYTAYIRFKRIGLYEGSCGAAAYLKQMVIVSDIEHDQRWATHREQALSHNLRACWSYPIINSAGDVIATFGIYYYKVTNPDERHISIITRSAGIIKIILENRMYAQMMQESNTLISQGQALANFGTWQWDVVADKVSWSEVLYHIYGVDPQQFNATFTGYIQRLHADDRARVQHVIQGALLSGQDVVFEERIIRPGGDIRYLKSWARVLKNEAGEPMKMIGACLDITEAKTARIKMEEIAWLQSHVIRAPLARLMGLTNLLADELAPADEDHRQLFNGIIDTARELDRVIHDITDNTKI